MRRVFVMNKDFFNGKLYPVLDMISNVKPFGIKVFRSDRGNEGDSFLIEAFKLNFRIYREFFEKHIYYASKPFSRSFNEANSKWQLVKGDLWDKIGTNYGTILNLPNSNGLQVMYFIDEGKSDGKHICCLVFFYKENLVGISLQNKTECSCFYSNIFFKGVKDHIYKEFPNYTEYEVINELDNYLHTLVVSFVNFIKYAKIETKTIDGSKSVKEFGCKYQNESRSSVTILNSSWFTNIVRSEGFKVRGHFRFQPKKKDGEWTKELIWINDFEKNGYTSPARKLNNI